ncbi:hypothetical protein [Streptomyces sp. WAC 06725]|nr:hypothetical protein [Streptomyces sp. WAC 06725]
MAEWTTPRYAELVRAYRAAQEDEGRDDAPVRGFIIPDTTKKQSE